MAPGALIMRWVWKMAPRALIMRWVWKMAPGACNEKGVENGTWSSDNEMVGWHWMWEVVASG